MIQILKRDGTVVPFNKDKIIIAINQCDLALKGRYWNYDKNEPNEQLVSFLEETKTEMLLPYLFLRKS